MEKGVAWRFQPLCTVVISAVRVRRSKIWPGMHIISETFTVSLWYNKSLAVFMS